MREPPSRILGIVAKVGVSGGRPVTTTAISPLDISESMQRHLQIQ
jgi:hypothetical protein